MAGSQNQLLAPSLETTARSIQWIVATLLMLGLVMVFSTRAPYLARTEGMDAVWRPLFDQGFKVSIGLVCFAVGYLIRPRWLLDRSGIIMAIAIVMLVMVNIPGLGAKINGARRWFTFGPGFQPVEFARICLIIFLAAWIEKKGPHIKNFYRGLLPPVLLVGLSVALLLLQPDFGSALFFIVLAALLLIFGGARLSHFLVLAMVSLPVCFLYGMNSLGHVKERVQGYLNADLGHQASQSLIALGSGGLGGADLGAGMSKLGYLPMISSDFILAALGEEMGFVGTSLVVLLFALLTVLSCRVALAQKSLGTFLLAAGLTVSIGMQAMVNIAVVTAAVPTKGIALPFVSAGGSSLALSLFGIGMLVQLARNSSVPDRGRGNG